MTAYIAEKQAAYLCKNNSWVELGNVSDSTSEKNNASSGIEKPTSSSTSSDEDSPKGFIREDISVTGVAQKGPFKFGSPLNLYELKKDLKPSGREYKDEISSNKGDFVIPKVSLAYPYAKLEVRGLYRNEVSGEWSTDSMTLRALTDFSEERTEVNINLLTHLEYDRALYLVQEKGYSVYAAKKQAAQEIMTAFEFATAVTYFEDFAIFQNEGVSANTVAGNSTLLAISALVMGNRSDAEIQSAIDKFREDIKTDGEWNDLQTKATMADWAYSFDYSTIRASVKSWNILDIPDYETYLDIYWNNVYGLGGCSVNRKDVIATNTNKLTKNYNKYFICNGSQWVEATTYQKDTYKWPAGQPGEFKKGNVTDTIYVYNGTKWEVAERETAIGICETSKEGAVSKFDGSYYICENGAWRASANEIENNLGACVTSREEETRKLGDVYYCCKSKTWTLVSGTLIDSRDNKTYKTITIGSQTWMAENLNYSDSATYEGMKGRSWCYDNKPENCTKYGRLYNWAAAMDSAGKWSTNAKGCGYSGVCLSTPPVRGICPEGWHLPTHDDFSSLFDAVGGEPFAAGKLKSTSGWEENPGNGTDSFGFSTLPAGSYDPNSIKPSYGEGLYAIFWCSGYGDYMSHYADLSSDCTSCGEVHLYETSRHYGFSIRCLKD